MKNKLSLRPAMLLLLIVVLLSACIPTSRHPLPLPADGKGDDRLIGRWTFVGEDEKGYVEISPTGGGRYHVLMISFGKDGSDVNARKTEMDILPTRIGGQSLVTVIGIFSPANEGEPDGAPHLIARYELTAQGDLLFYPMSLEALAEDVRAGLVAGEVKPGEMWDNVSLTVDSETLAAYITAADSERIFTGRALYMRRP